MFRGILGKRVVVGETRFQRPTAVKSGGLDAAFVLRRLGEEFAVAAERRESWALEEI